LSLSRSATTERASNHVPQASNASAPSFIVVVSRLSAAAQRGHDHDFFRRAHHGREIRRQFAVDEDPVKCAFAGARGLILRHSSRAP